jgi:hypothetical protein
MYNMDPAQGGIKKDDGKALWHLLPEPVLEGVVDVLALGATKYAEWNWAKGMKYSRVYNSARRHQHAFFWRKEDFDKESGLHHLDHAICNLLFLRYYTMRYPEQDDRVSLLPPVATPEAAASSCACGANVPVATPSDPAQTLVLRAGERSVHRTTLSQSGRPHKAQAWPPSEVLQDEMRAPRTQGHEGAVEPDEDDIPF